MTLRRKLLVTFSAGAALATALVFFSLAQIGKIDREIYTLELSDTVRNTALELRRHEKNFFLYRRQSDLSAVEATLAELEAALSKSEEQRFRAISLKTAEYHTLFGEIVTLASTIHVALDSLKRQSPGEIPLIEYVEGTFLEDPPASAHVLQLRLGLSDADPAVRLSDALGSKVQQLRKIGETLLSLTNEFDRASRAEAEGAVFRTRIAARIFLPTFLALGIGASLLMGRSIARRLAELARQIEKTSKGFNIASGSDEAAKAPGDRDEIDVIIRKYRQMESQLAEHEEALLQSKKLSAIGTLASGVAHELNNPLNNIYTTAQRLNKKIDLESDPVLKKGLQDIFGQTLRVKKIVGDLLEFARTRAPHLEDIELEALIRTSYNYIVNSMDVREVEFALMVAPEAPRCIHADPTQMEQVFINLFTNAVEAMGGRGSITVTVEPAGDRVSVEVANSGRGIPDKLLERIFEPFYSTKDKGTGLGLAVVYSIITKHGGEIRAASAEEEGTIFTITLPGATMEDDRKA